MTCQNVRRKARHGHGHDVKTSEATTRDLVQELGLGVVRGVPPTLPPPKKKYNLGAVAFDQSCAGLFLLVIYGYWMR